MDKPWSKKQLETEILVLLFQSQNPSLIRIDYKLEIWIQIYSNFMASKGYLFEYQFQLDISGTSLTIMWEFRAIQLNKLLLSSYFFSSGII